MSIVVVGIAVLLLAAVVAIVATGRRRAATGRLRRETVQADQSSRERAPDLVPAGVVGTEEARERADEARATIEGAGGVPAPTGDDAVALPEPIDEEELGVTRRQFFNRGILTFTGIGVGAFGVAALGFLWPSGGGGFGGKLSIGSVSDVESSWAKSEPFYNAGAKTYIVPYPEDALANAQEVYGEQPPVLAGMEQGYVALYQKCPHLGCRVPWCQSSQWFECPCHGSKYNRVGEKKGGPAPRGMDRFGVEVAGGSVVVDTARIWTGPPIGTNTTGQGQEGAPCV